MTRSAAARLVVAVSLILGASAMRAAEVRFEINDAQVKNQPVAGARILLAAEPGGEAIAFETGADGVAVMDIAPGSYFISYLKAGYVPIRESATEIREGGQVITTTMSRLLEAAAGVSRRVRIVLNWGSDPDDARDVDGHAFCACGEANPWVYFGAMEHEHQEHSVVLDVDDTDWGGPETITLNEPPPGRYVYRVHQYSHDADALGQSDLVVRVFFNDALAAETRVPLAAERNWRPFRELVVDSDLTPRLVRWTSDEIGRGEPLEAPPEAFSEEARGSGFCSLAAVGGLALLILVVVTASRVGRWKARGVR